MPEFLLVVILIVLFIRWLVLSRRMASIEQRIEDVATNRASEARLIARIYALEQVVKELRGAAEPKPEPAPTPFVIAKAAPEPAVVTPQPQPETVPQKLNLCELCGRALPEPPAICECRVQVETPEPAPVEEEKVGIPVAIFEVPAAQPTLSQRLRDSMQGEEWEAVVGGSWLNKLGVFILVVGIALFLAFSFTKVGPGGRAAIGLAVSLSMLIGGFLLEKRPRYKIFARGFLGGGWAALYFTVYAMQAVEAAKVIDNPWLGGFLLLGVATGMIVHSLRYQSQTVTALAYFVAFVTLAITPVTTLSVIALVPLGASLLYVAHRFSWSKMAFFGLLATYGTCASRGDSGAPLWSAQVVFSTYWLLFEGFDLLQAKRRKQYTLWESAIFPLNALAFLALSYLKWSIAAPQHLHALAGGIGAVYLVSTVLRVLVRPPSSFDAETGTVERALSGGYEGPVTLTAALTVAAMYLKFHGALAHLGLLAEAELLFLAGLYFTERYPRQLGAALFAGGLSKLALVDLPAGERTTLAGWNFRAWTPLAALSAAMFYVNRVLRKADTFYGYAGSAVVAAILGFETPERYIGVSWFALAAILFSFGWWKRLADFRLQGYIAGSLGFCGVSVHQINVATGASAPVRYPWISLSVASLISYLGVLCGLRSAADRLDEWEREGLRRVGSWAATLGMLALAWRVLPSDYLGFGWMVLSLPLLELGLRQIPEDFRVQAYAVGILGALRVLLFDVIPIANNGPLGRRLMIGGAALAAYLFAARIYAARDKVPSGVRVFDLSSATATLFLLSALWALLPAVVIGPAWAVVALLLMETGFLLDIPSLRLQSHFAGAAAFGRLFFANFTGLGRVGIVSHRLLTVVPVIVLHYYQWSRQRAEDARLRGWERSLARLYLYAPAILAAVMMRFELGRVLTVTGWSALALGLLYFGRRWNNVDLRWQSYILAVIAFWRSWTTNFYAPESFGGVSGRVATGAFMIACFYIAQLLIPRKSVEEIGIEKHARTFYSLLATALLAVLLFYEVSGSVLTVAWGIEGVALLIAGFPLSDRVQRLSGLALFLVCILKLFVYDLRHLETMYRILSFIVLGLMLVSVSWVYTRFRDRIQRYL